MSDLPPYASRELVAERLPLIFPEGTPNRTYCIREMAASTVFVALYIGAVEGADRYLGPIHVYRMTKERAAQADVAMRLSYTKDTRKKDGIAGARWYADNTREPIRDETLREGLVEVGAVTARGDLPTTSSKPRYALRSAFAALFNPALDGEALEQAIAGFQQKHLSKSALARVSIITSIPAPMTSRRPLRSTISTRPTSGTGSTGPRGGSDASVTDAKPGTAVSAPGSSPCRCSRRHVDSKDRDIPCRRAVADTSRGPAKLSSVMRTFSATLQRRRRPVSTTSSIITCGLSLCIARQIDEQTSPAAGGPRRRVTLKIR